MLSVRAGCAAAARQHVNQQSPRREETLRVPYKELEATLERVLAKIGFEPARAHLCARLFAETSRDGVYSHGLNRFPRFLAMIENGMIDIHSRPERIAAVGSLERWDAKLGPGNLSAYESMARAISLARGSGLGCVALANTNHWMRGGTYGWQAAEAGVIGVCWTNTLPNVPPWGASDPRLGNNPLVIGVPRPGGHVVLDMAVSQFSYGALASYRERGESLPVEGGYDWQGRLTRDPGAIEESGRALPIGYWKGSGLSLALDLMAAMLSGGLSATQLSSDSLKEGRVSQVFLAFNLAGLDPSDLPARIAEQIVSFVQLPPGSSGERVRTPGEKTLASRAENLRLGVPVDAKIWSDVRALSQGS
ncbi:MAG: 3-dehydro-L-gulonate 2-dehydrogenase [Candidatus Acidiferrales bacterium]